jgi:DNA polymerase-3 subunit gamma/tau
MSYTALARKWRPRRFDELTGQEHVLRALSNALDSGRVHHAFLFTGTRGVGKTTIARILAKCLNCEVGVSSRPCGVCASCREIDEGRFIDLIEVDAATNTKVDDTRELLDNVQYAPSRGRYKVYLIDEVHMLTQHSFNALLKTLEEPPPHVKFLLATTDPHKLPVTVLSRCLQFNLKRLPVALIGERMRTILQAEGLPFDAPAVRLLAQAADGSMRDGLSLLDQLIAYGGGRVEEDAARAMLGTVDRTQVARLAGLLADGEPGALLAFVQQVDEWAPDYGQLLEALAALLARVTMRQVVPGYEGDELHPPELLEALAARIGAEDLQLYYQTAILGRRDLSLAPDPRIGFEMTLLRMAAFRLANDGATAAPVQRNPASGLAAGSAIAAPAAPAAPASRATGPVVAAAPGPGPSAGLGQAGPPLEPGRWVELVAALDIGGMVRQLAAHCALVAVDGAILRLALDPKQQHLRTAGAVEKLAQALSRHHGSTLRVEIELVEPAVETPALAEERHARAEIDAARGALESDPTVRALQDRFGATLQADSVRPRRT